MIVTGIGIEIRSFDAVIDIMLTNSFQPLINKPTIEGQKILIWLPGNP